MAQSPPSPPVWVSVGDHQSTLPNSEPLPPYSFKFQQHIGRQYNSSTWGEGNIRDTLHDAFEISNAYEQLTPLNQKSVVLHTNTGTAYNTLASDAFKDFHSNYDLTTLIGGLGSAKYRRLPDTKAIDVESGLASEMFRDYMASVEDADQDGRPDYGTTWRSLVYQRGMDVASHVSNDEHIFSWQIGNEISAASYSFNVVRWLVEKGELSREELSDTEFDSGLGFDQRIIPVYVKYFLAPTVQALMQANKDSGKDIPIVLGSITGYGNLSAQTFLDTLLNFEITESSVGEYAKDLWGKKVYEIVDIASVHYHLATIDANNPFTWRDRLEAFKIKCLDTNILDGIWSTEELGIKAAESGRGAQLTLRVASRLLSWVDENELNAKQAKVFFYGDNNGPDGTTGVDGLTLLWDFIQGESLQLVERQALENNKLEKYSFQSTESDKKFITLGQNNKEGSHTVSIVDFPSSTLSQSHKISVKLITPTSINDVTHTINAGRIEFSAIELSELDLLLITIN